MDCSPGYDILAEFKINLCNRNIGNSEIHIKTKTVKKEKNKTKINKQNRIKENSSKNSLKCMHS